MTGTVGTQFFTERIPLTVELSLDYGIMNLRSRERPDPSENIGGNRMQRNKPLRIGALPKGSEGPGDDEVIVIDDGPQLLEVCIDCIASGFAAEAGGAKRIELCSALSEGGLTPSIGFLQEMKKHLKIPIYVMIRPRGGDFAYSKLEIESMKVDIRECRAHGADGFVFGVLNMYGEVDEKRCRELLEETDYLPTTFHRAFDMTPDPDGAMEQIIGLGFKRILTSGQSRSAQAGKSVIRRLVEKANGRITIMAGAGINPDNVREIIDSTNVREVHASCRTKVPCQMQYNQGVHLGTANDEMNNLITHHEVVRGIVRNLRG